MLVGKWIEFLCSLFVTWLYCLHLVWSVGWHITWQYTAPWPLFAERTDIYSKISRSLEAARLATIMVVSLSNLTGIPAVLLSMCLLNFRAIGKIWTWISQLRDFARYCSKTSVRLVNRSPCSAMALDDGMRLNTFHRRRMNVYARSCQINVTLICGLMHQLSHKLILSNHYCSQNK